MAGSYRKENTAMPRLSVQKHDLTLTNEGVEINLSQDYQKLEQETMERLHTILTPYPKATRFLDTLVADPEVRANWDMADYIAVAKLHYNDHGEVHHKVVAAASCAILQLLTDANIQPDVVSSGAGDTDDAFLTVMSASLLHDIGNQVHRDGHWTMSVVLSLPILDRLLPSIYEELEQRYEIRGSILHAIRTHDIDVRPLTMEAAIVSVADACDMTKGRSNYALDIGSISIHTIGGVSIERVLIEKGKRKPIQIRVELSNSAGIFPVEEYLVPKINAGELAQHVEVTVTTEPETSKSDQRIIYTVEMEGKKFVAVRGDAGDKG
jgi:metal-dependent HD superfamily phosphatase/phosphodiesterase